MLGSRSIRHTVAPVVALALSVPSVEAIEVYRERPDDAPSVVPAHADATARSAAARATVGGFTSIQVNVDALGQNIVGDAANEPSIAVDPNDPMNLVIGWRQFDTITSNFRQAGWAYSSDGGASWTFPGSIDAGEFRSDPVIETDSNGSFFYQSLTGSLRLDVFRSTDSGQSWEAGVDSFGGDKNWMTIDKSGSLGNGHIYGIWQPVFGCCGDDTITRSTNGGQSFEQPFNAPENPTFGTLAVGPTGELYAAGVQASPFFQNFETFVVSRSDNARNPFFVPTFTTTVVDMGGPMRLGGGPNPDGLLGQAWVDVDVSDTERNGEVYLLATVDPPGSDPADIHFSRSTDGGQTWSEPLRINDDASGNWQWFGTLGVAPNGRIDVVWNDTRNSGSERISELFYTWSYDGGRSWSGNVAVSPSFDSHLGWPNQNKLGDYYDIVSDEAGASLAWAATFNGEQDVYFLRLYPDCNANGVADVDDIEVGTSADLNGDVVPDECQLIQLAPDPGLTGEDNTLTAEAGTPGSSVTFVVSETEGSTPVPGCAGETVGLDAPIVLGSAVVGADGRASLTRTVPPSAAGTSFLFQAVEIDTCTVSQVIPYTFP